MSDPIVVQPEPGQDVIVVPQSPIKMSAPKVLLEGPPGAGKTHALTTYMKAGVELFAITTESGGEETLIEACKKQNLPIDKLHWMYIPTANPEWSTLESMINQVSIMGYEDLSKIKQGGNKKDYMQFLQLIKACANFKCARTGKEFGPVDKWGDDKALGLDSLSGISTMAYDAVLGTKLAPHQGEWGIAMNMVEKFLLKITSDVSCHVCLTSHIENEFDEIAGFQKKMVSTLGKKLAPKIPKMFSDVVLAYREGGKFLWSTDTAQHDLKARTLPLKAGLLPDFGQVVDGWNVRKKLAASV